MEEVVAPLPISPESNVFHIVHLVATYDDTTLKLYVDGPDDDAGTPDAQLPTAYSPNPGKPLYIGMGAPEREDDPGGVTPLYPFLGRIQEVAVYNVALMHDVVAVHTWNGNMEA